MADWQKTQSPAVALCDFCDERAVSACLQCRDLFCMFHARKHRGEEESHVLQDLAKPQRQQQQEPPAQHWNRHQNSRHHDRRPSARSQENRPYFRATPDQAFSPVDRSDQRHMMEEYEEEMSDRTSEWRLGEEMDYANSDFEDDTSVITDSGFSDRMSDFMYPNLRFNNMDGHQIQNLTPHLPRQSDNKIQFSSVMPDSVCLKWPPPEGATGHQMFKVTWTRKGQDSNSTKVRHVGVRITGLLPGERYKFIVSTIGEDKNEYPYVEGDVETDVPPPENLILDTSSSSVSLTWTKPAKVDQVSYLLELSREQGNIDTIHSTDPHFTITDPRPGENYHISVYTVMTNGNQSKAVSKAFQLGPGLLKFLSNLGLGHHHEGKITLSSVLEITRDTVSHKPADNFQDLPKTFLKELIMANINVRNLECLQAETSDANDETHAINPLDLVTALFLCSDPFLQQEIVSKMSMCQFAVPLLLPNCETQQSTLMLWAMRDLVKRFRPHTLTGDKAFLEDRVVEMDMPMVSFVRLGESSLAKSQTINRILSIPQLQNHTFVHHDMEGGDVPRTISDGLVEVSWYLPSGNRNTDMFTEPVAISNLRGDGLLCKSQLSFLCQASAVVVIFSDDFEGYCSTLTDKNNTAKLILVTNSQGKNFSEEKIKDICRIHKIKDKNVIVKRRQNEAEFVKTLRLCVTEIIERKPVRMKMVEMAGVARQTGVEVDEDSSECIQGREYAETISKTIEDVAKFKDEHLPLHGQMWKEISQTEKEMYRMKNLDTREDKTQYSASLQIQIDNLRKDQYQKGISEAMNDFKTGLSQSNVVRLYFLKWLNIQLDDVCHRNPEKGCEIPEPDGETPLLTASLNNQISNDVLSLEHFFRELGQLYECACSLPESDKIRKQVQNMPCLCAQLLLDGFPVELVDGDTSNIPIKWISDVLTQLHQLVNTRSRILVLSVLGVQGSGNSTLLNTMFGVHTYFRGKSARGPLMQLIKVSEEVRSEFKCDFILIIDTEGLQSPEWAGLEKRYEHDNALATLVLGISDITIINVGIENITELKDILQIVVHAFLRIKEVLKKPRCLFVHQNMSAQQSNMRNGKELLEQLNEMTHLAAEMERGEVNMKFTDMMQHDPDKDNYYIPALWNGTHLMAPVDAGYRDAVFGLKKRLIDSVQTSNDTDRDDATELYKLTKRLWNAVKSENFIFNFRNSMVAHAHTELDAEYKKWELSYRYTMKKWCHDATLKFSKPENLAEPLSEKLKQEAATALDDEDLKIIRNLDDYLARSGSHVEMLKEYEEKFMSSIRCLRTETENMIEEFFQELTTTTVGEGKVKIQTNTIRKKAQELREVVQEKMKDLPEDQEKEGRISAEDAIMNELALVFKPVEDVCQRVLRILVAHFNMRSGHVKGLITESNLQKGGLEKFDLNKINRRWFARKYSHKIQDLCDAIIKDCQSFVSRKAQRGIVYSDAYIREILRTIDENLKGKGLDEECEVILKLHVCGHATREFQKVHKRINDECAKQNTRCLFHY